MRETDCRPGSSRDYLPHKGGADRGSADGTAATDGAAPLPPPVDAPSPDPEILGTIGADFPPQMVRQRDGSFKAIYKPTMIHAEGWKGFKGGNTGERLECFNQFRKGLRLRRCADFEDAQVNFPRGIPTLDHHLRRTPQACGRAVCGR